MNEIDEESPDSFGGVISIGAVTMFYLAAGYLVYKTLMFAWGFV